MPLEVVSSEIVLEKTILRMNFNWFLVFFVFRFWIDEVCLQNVEMLESILSYYQCRSVIFIVGDNSPSKFLKLQKIITKNFYFSTSMTLPIFSRAVELGYHGGKQTVVVIEYDNQLFTNLTKLTQQADISTYKWLVTTSDFQINNFKFLQIPVVTEFLVAHGNSTTGYILREIYEVEPRRMLVKRIGNWAAGQGIDLELMKPDLFNRRKNLQKTVIRTVSTSLDPCKLASIKKGVDSVVLCIHSLVWDAIIQDLNATNEIVLEPNLNSSTISTSDAHITLRSAPMNTRHMIDRSYIWPVFGTKLEVFASYAGQEVKWKTFLRPFSTGMWMVILFWVVLCDTLLIAAEYITSTDKTKGWMDYYRKYSFMSTFAFCNQGVSDVPVMTSYRLMFFLAFLVPTVLLPGYSAVLTSFVTVQLPKMPFINLEELSKSEGYRLGWHRSFPFQMLFNENDTNPINQALLANNLLPRDQMPASDIVAIDKMCTEKFVFITNILTMIALKPKCSFFKFDQHYTIVFTTIETKKNSHYWYLFNRCMRKLKFSGVIQRIIIKIVSYFVTYEDFEFQKPEEFAPILMENSVLPFVVLFSTMGVSLIILAFEIFCYKLRNKKKYFSLSKLNQIQTITL